jgi:transposase
MLSLENYRNQPRRRFSREFKREVVELLLAQAATVAEVARTYDLHPNQLCRWRTEYFRGEYGATSAKGAPPATFLPVEVADTLDMPKALAVSDAPDAVQGGIRCRIPRLKVVLAKGQILLEDIGPEHLGLLIEALK